jgi:hypothetical protein
VVNSSSPLLTDRKMICNNLFIYVDVKSRGKPISRWKTRQYFIEKYGNNFFKKELHRFIAEAPYCCTLTLTCILSILDGIRTRPFIMDQQQQQQNISRCGTTTPPAITTELSTVDDRGNSKKAASWRQCEGWLQAQSIMPKGANHCVLVG